MRDALSGKVSLVIAAWGFWTLGSPVGGSSLPAASDTGCRSFADVSATGSGRTRGIGRLCSRVHGGSSRPMRRAKATGSLGVVQLTMFAGHRRCPCPRLLLRWARFRLGWVTASAHGAARAQTRTARRVLGFGLGKQHGRCISRAGGGFLGMKTKRASAEALDLIPAHGRDRVSLLLDSAVDLDGAERGEIPVTSSILSSKPSSSDSLLPARQSSE